MPGMWAALTPSDRFTHPVLGCRFAFAVLVALLEVAVSPNGLPGLPALIEEEDVRDAEAVPVAAVVRTAERTSANPSATRPRLTQRRLPHSVKTVPAARPLNSFDSRLPPLRC